MTIWQPKQGKSTRLVVTRIHPTLLFYLYTHILRNRSELREGTPPFRPKMRDTPLPLRLKPYKVINNLQKMSKKAKQSRKIAKKIAHYFVFSTHKNQKKGSKYTILYYFV
jgi:hypothetical protein